MRDTLADFSVSDGYKLHVGQFGDDSGIWQGTSRCCFWDTNEVWHKHPLRDISDELLAAVEAIDKKKRRVKRVRR